MSSNENNIEQKIKHKLLNTSIEPPASSWDRLADQLDKQHSKNRLLFFIRLTAAAVIILLISLGIVFLSPSNNQTIEQQPLSQADSTKNQKTENIIKETKKDTIQLPTQKPESIIALVEKTPSSETHPEPSIKRRINLAYMQIRDFISPIQQKERMNTLIARNELVVNKSEVFDWSAYEIADPISDIENKARKWRTEIAYSPIYSSGSDNTNTRAFENAAEAAVFTGGSNNVSDPNENTLPSLSFGVNISYNFSERWGLISGLYYLNEKNEIQNFYLVGNNINLDPVYSMNSSAGNINITESEEVFGNAIISDQYDLTPSRNYSYFDSDLVQNFKYIEVPILLSYQLIDKKYKIALIGGLNTGFLIENTVYLKNYKSENVGSTENMNNIVLKSVIGISFEYPIFKRIFLTFAPTYKYQLTDINNVSFNNQHLKILDIKSGISYHF